MATIQNAGSTRSARRSVAPESKSQRAVRTLGALAGTGVDKPAVPEPNIESFLDGFKLPGVDLKSIVEAQRADIRAVALANKRAYDCMKTLAKRQDEMLRAATADWRVAVRALAAMDADRLLARRTALARQAIRKALADVRELADTGARSQAEAWQAIGTRQRDNLSVSKKALPRR